MKAELGTWLQFHIAQRCAEIIHAEIVNRRLGRVGISSHFHKACDEMSEVRALFRSLSPERHGPRAEMRSSVKYWLKELKKERRTEHCWQDYVRSVAELNRVPCPGANTDLAWATFILKDRAAA